MKCDTIRSFAAQILSGAKDHRGGERVEAWETVTGRRVVFVAGDGRQVKQRSFAALRMTGPLSDPNSTQEGGLFSWWETGVR